MLEELLEIVSGPWGIAVFALTVLPSGRTAMRNMAKGVIRAGMGGFNEVKIMKDEIKEDIGDIKEEIKTNRKKKGHSSTPDTAHKH